MDRHVAALVLDEIATLTALTGGNRFAVRAYRNAARAVEKLDGDPAALLESGELADTPGIGEASLAVIRDLVETGGSRLHERLRRETPSGMVEMLEIPGLGAGRIARLHDELGVDSLDELERAADEGRVAELHGFGPATQQRILDGIAHVRGAAGRRMLVHADEAAYRLCRALEAEPGIARVGVGGELRRRCETVGAVELIVAAEDVEAAVGAAAELPGLRDVRAAEPDPAGCLVTARLSDGFGVRALCLPPDTYAVALLLSTGSEAHVRALRERAERIGAPLGQLDGEAEAGGAGAPADAGIYTALDLQPVPPELREGADEIERAAAGTLPRLIHHDDLRGCFHNHTDASDGRDSLEDMARGAMQRGWRYLGIADHSKSAFYAGGLSADEVRRQHDAIERWNDAHGDELRLLKGIECDVMPDGTIDFADEPDVLEAMDYVVASVHSGFRMSREDMTRRMVRAVSDPRVRMLGHATGRLLLRRAGYDVDLVQVLAAAAEHDTAVELNADPRRLELDWRLWRRARELGVRCAINPDAHSVAGLDNVRYGVDIARKGWLEKGDVVNTWGLPEVMEWLGA